MSVTTTGPVNMEQLAKALPGHAFSSSGDLTAAGALIWAPNKDVTDAQITTALAGITYQAPAVAVAVTTIDTLLADLSALETQIQTDAASVANWATLSASEQAAIMGRVVNGFAQVVGAIYAHLAVSGDL